MAATASAHHLRLHAARFYADGGASSRSGLSAPPCRLPESLPRRKVVSALKVKRQKEPALDRVIEKNKRLRMVSRIADMLLQKDGHRMTLHELGKHRRRIGLTGNQRCVALLNRFPGLFKVVDDGGGRVWVSFTPSAEAVYQQERLLKQALKEEVVTKIRKILMLSPSGRVRLETLGHLRRELGLPEDFRTSLVLEYPQFFRVTGSQDEGRGCENGDTDPPYLELTLWDPALAVSALSIAEAGRRRDRDRDREATSTAAAAACLEEGPCPENRDLGVNLGDVTRMAIGSGSMEWQGVTAASGIAGDLSGSAVAGSWAGDAGSRHLLGEPGPDLGGRELGTREQKGDAAAARAMELGRRRVRQAVAWRDRGKDDSGPMPTALPSDDLGPEALMPSGSEEDQSGAAHAAAGGEAEPPALLGSGRTKLFGRTGSASKQAPFRLPPGVALKRSAMQRLRSFYEVPLHQVSPYEHSEATEGKSSVELERKWVAAVHELLSLTVEKRLLVDQVTHLKKDLRLTNQLYALLLKHPEFFYVSAKGPRHTVFLREAYLGDTLIQKSEMSEALEKLRRLALARNQKFSETVVTGDGLEGEDVKIEGVETGASSVGKASERGRVDILQSSEHNAESRGQDGNVLVKERW